MIDRENVIKNLHDIGGFIAGRVGIEQARNFLRTIDYTVSLLKEQETQKFFVDESGKITPLPVVVRCKDCKHYRKDTCSAGAGMAFPPPDDWYCADGEREPE